MKRKLTFNKLSFAIIKICFLLKAVIIWNLFSTHTIPTKVIEEMNSLLLRPFTKLDIEAALKNMAPDKALGEDGFLAFFYQKYWHIVENDVCQFCLQILNNEADMSSKNHTLITLIFKIEKPLRVANFLVSRCNVLYKLISKAMVNCLKTILPMLYPNFKVHLFQVVVSMIMW